MRLENFGTLIALQRFELVRTTEDVHPDYARLPYRISTREYACRITLYDGGYEMRWHWHPVGHGRTTLTAHKPYLRMINANSGW